MSPADTVSGIEHLRGLHLPGHAAGLVEGEIVVAMALGFAAALIAGLVRHLYRRSRIGVRRSALNALAAAGRLDPETRLVAQARLLRRIVRTLQGDEAASLRGPAWAVRLDEIFATDAFSNGIGRVFVDGLYGRRERPDSALLDAELSRLIGRLRA